MAGGQEKTEKATPKRRGEARSKGNIARSKEFPAVAVLLAGLLTIVWTAENIFNEMSGMLRYFLGHLGRIPVSVNDEAAFFNRILMTGVRVTGPIMGVVALTALLSNYAQVGWLFTTETLKPNLAKLNPITGLKNLISARGLVELVKSVVKLFIVGFFAYRAVTGELDTIVTLGDRTAGAIWLYILEVTYRIFLRCCLVMLVLAALDYAYQKWKFEKDLKMTKQEVKDEFKQREGDPLVRGRIRQIQRQLAQGRMLDKVPQADVVVTNPTHLAVALQYVSGEMDAPRVVAKGADLVAEKIKQLAKAYKVPVVENKPLARALFKVRLNQVIPAELYQTVAQVLAYVYQQREQRFAAAGARG